MSIRFAAAALIASSALFSVSSYAQAPVKTEGGILVNTAGMTVYTFDNDAANSGKSSCNGPCAKIWPPLMANASDKAAGDFTLVTRDDGSKQWAHKGKPLYLFEKDSKPGEMTGDKVKDVWHVVKP